MDKNQKINCTVNSCAYQDNKNNRCTLQTIDIMPKAGCGTKRADESMCGSYECGE